MNIAPLTPAHILIEAATILAEGGWTRGTMHDPQTGARCAYGALDAAAAAANITTLGTEFDDAYNLLVDYLIAHNASYVTGGEGSVGGWNDHPSRTAEEVIATLLDAAEQIGGVANADS